jgi:thiamine biosynthesis protein ThiS
MMLMVNGQEQDCRDGLSLSEFIEQLGLKSDRVAVELNRRIAPRARWAEIELKAGDKLEIVHFVGGGCAGSGEYCSRSA